MRSYGASRWRRLREDVGGELGRRGVSRFEAYEALRYRETQGIGAGHDRSLSDRRMFDGDRLQLEGRNPVV